MVFYFFDAGFAVCQFGLRAPAVADCGYTAVVFGTKTFPKVPSVRPSVDQQAHNNANNDGGHTDTNRPWLHNCHNCFSPRRTLSGKAADHVPNAGALWSYWRRVP